MRRNSGRGNTGTGLRPRAGAGAGAAARPDDPRSKRDEEEEGSGELWSGAVEGTEEERRRKGLLVFGCGLSFGPGLRPYGPIRTSYDRFMDRPSSSFH